MDQSLVDVGFRSFRSLPEAAVPKVVSKQPDPTLFVPLLYWNADSVWVFVKKKGSPVPEGPVQIPHNKIQNYAGKLGWLSQKMPWVGKLDPTTYAGPGDIYPLDWVPGDALPGKPVAAVAAQAVVFEPIVKSNKEVTAAVTVQPKAATAEAPASLPADPGEFEIQSKKDVQGYSQVKHKGTGTVFSMLPGGKVAQWSEVEEKYYVHVKGEHGWEIDFDHPLLAPGDVTKPAPTAPQGFVVPAGYTLTAVTPAFVMATTPGGEAVKYDLKKQTWFKMDAPWEEHAVTPPPEEQPAATPTATMLTEPPKPEVIPKPEVSPSVEPVATPVPPPETVTLAADPEKLPKHLKFVGHLDPNGLPMVDEDYGDDEDPEYGEKGLTLLPDDRVGRWMASSGYYRLYHYHPTDGYIPVKKGQSTIKYPDVAKIMERLRLVVKDWQYFKLIQVKSATKNEPGFPVGFAAAAPTEMEKELGLVPLIWADAGPGAKFYLLPGNLIAAGGKEEGPYDVFAVDDAGELKATADKDLTLQQVQLMTKGLAYKPPAHASFVSGKDVNGYPMIKTIPLDPDDDPSTITMLPNGEVAQWQKAGKQYHVWVWEKSDGDYFPSHPPKYYTLKQVEKMKPKPMAGSMPAVIPVKTPVVPAVPTPAPVTLPAAVAPAPAPAPEPEVPPKGKAPEHTEYVGAVDVNGFQKLVSPKGVPFSEIPIETKVGYWNAAYQAYQVEEWNPSLLGGSGAFAWKKTKDGALIWYTQDETGKWVLYIGQIPLGGLKKATETAKEAEKAAAKAAVPEEKAPAHTKLTGKQDLRGLPELLGDDGYPYTLIPVDTRVGLWGKFPGFDFYAYLVQAWESAEETFFAKDSAGDFLWWRIGDTDVLTQGALKAKIQQGAPKTKAPEHTKFIGTKDVNGLPKLEGEDGGVYTHIPVDTGVGYWLQDPLSTGLGAYQVWEWAAGASVFQEKIDNQDQYLWWIPGTSEVLNGDAFEVHAFGGGKPAPEHTQFKGEKDGNGLPKLLGDDGYIYSFIPIDTGVGVQQYGDDQWGEFASLIYKVFEWGDDVWESKIGDNGEKVYWRLGADVTLTSSQLKAQLAKEKAGGAGAAKVPETPEPAPAPVAPISLPPGFIVPAGYTVTSSAPTHVTAVTPTGEKVIWINKLKSWWSADEPGKEHRLPPAAATSIPTPAVAATLPIGTEFTGEKDLHGFPLIKGADETVYSNIPIASGVGVWHSDVGAYRVYEPWDHGVLDYIGQYVESKQVWWFPGAPTLSFGDWDEIKAPEASSMQSVGPVGGALTPQIPKGAELTGGTDVNGFQTLKDPYVIVSVLPIGKFGEWVADYHLYRIWKWDEDGKFFTVNSSIAGYEWWGTGDKETTIGQAEEINTKKAQEMLGEAPKGTEFTGGTDHNGRPYVKEVNTAKTYSLLPDGLGRWMAHYAIYRVLTYDEASGVYVLKGAGSTAVWWIPGALDVFVGTMDDALDQVGVVPKGTGWAPTEPEGAVATGQAPPGLVWTDEKDVNGFPVVLYPAWSTATEKAVFSLIPMTWKGKPAIGEWDKTLGVYGVLGWDESAKFYKSAIIDDQLVWWHIGATEFTNTPPAEISKAVPKSSVSLPLGVNLTGDDDINGLPIVMDSSGITLSILPIPRSGYALLGLWKVDKEAYRVLAWSSAQGTYTFDEDLEGNPIWWVIGAKSVYAGEQPPSPVSGKAAPKPSAAVPTAPKAQGVPAGMHLIPSYDLNGVQYMVDTEGGDGVKFSFIPVDTKMGLWEPVNKGYRVMEAVGEGKGSVKGAYQDFDQKKIKGKKVWWVYGEPTIYVGQLKKGGKKKATAGEVPVAVSGIKDDSSWIHVTGVDANGLPTGKATYPKALGGFTKFTKIPVDTHVGLWVPGSAAYLVLFYDLSTGNYQGRKQNGQATWWVFGDAAVQFGDTPKPKQSATHPKSSLIGSLGLTIPEVSNLNFLGDGAALGYPGAGKKDIYIDPKTNTRYIFKPAYLKGSKKIEPFRAYVQEAYSALAMKLRPDHIPIKTIEVNGVLGTIQPEVSLAELPTYQSSGLTPETMTSVQRGQVVTDHVMDWVMSQHDSHGENVVVAADGRLLSIDKEQGFRFFPNDQLSVSYDPNGVGVLYNSFWKAFAKGSFDYDPRPTLKTAFDKLHEIPTAEYVAMLRPYINSVHPNDPKKQRTFLKRALARKLNARQDFEKFLTGLYEKRFGEAGKFDLEKGWIPESLTHVKTKVAVPSVMTSTGVYSRKYEYKNKTTGLTEYDETRMIMKVKKHVGKQKLVEFLDNAKLTPLPFPDGELMIEGDESYKMCVSKAAYEEATLEMEVPVDAQVKPTPVVPEYWAGVDTEDAPAPANLEVLNTKVSKMAVDAGGLRVTFDGGLVEGFNGKGRKYKDAQGEYLQFQFKLRKHTWVEVDAYLKAQKIGTAGEFVWYRGNVDSSGQVNLTTSEIDSDAKFAATVVTKPAGTIYVASISKGSAYQSGGADNFTPYTYAGMVVIQVRDVTANAQEILKSFLGQIKPGLAEQLMKKPTPEEELRRKYFRVIWAFGGAAADSLDPDMPTEELRKKAVKWCKDTGYEEADIARIEEQEVFPGYNAQVLPGRHRRLAKGKAWFVLQEFKKDGIPGVLTYGLMGIHQRNQVGMDPFGASYGSDSNSGAGDNSCSRLITEPQGSYDFGYYHYGSYGAICHPEILDRLDLFMHYNDGWGKCCPSSSTWTSRQGLDAKVLSVGLDHEQSSHELVVRQGIPLSRILRIGTTSEEKRKDAIAMATEAGIKVVNGIPVESFIVVCAKFKDAWERYVKPIMVD